MGLLQGNERIQLIELLQDLPNVTQAGVRRSLISGLPSNFNLSINFSDAPLADLIAIVDTANSDIWENLPDDPRPIIRVIENALLLGKGSQLATKLQELLQKVQTRATSIGATKSSVSERAEGPAGVGSAYVPPEPNTTTTERLVNDHQFEHPSRSSAMSNRSLLPDSDWEKSYLARLTGTLGRLDAALSLVKRSFPLNDVYTPLRLHRPHRSSAEPVTWDSILRSNLVALTGDAGSGKSTLLRYLAFQIAQHRQRQLDPTVDIPATKPIDPSTVGSLDPLTLPVFIDLARTPSAGSTGRSHRQEAPNDQTEAWLKLIAANLQLQDEQTKALLQEGGVFLLVDGLDEVTNPADREKVVEGLVSIQRAYNSPRALNRVVISCRQAAWTGRGVFGSFEQIALQPMDATIAEAYLTAWCRAIWGQQAPTVFRRLQNTLRRSPGLAKVAQSPQMAAMLALLDYGEEVPYQRALLYEMFINRLIRINEEVNHRISINNEVNRDHLVALALEMQRAQLTDGEHLNAMRYREVTAFLDKRVASEPATRHQSGLNGAALLKELNIQTGLLEVDEPRGLSHLNSFVRFKHRTFQEFLTAYYYCANYEQERSGLLEHATEPAWAEVLAFCCGLLAERRPASVRDLLEQILQTPDANAPAEELADWAPRLAAASVCVTELASYLADDKDKTLEPMRKAQDLASRLLKDPNEIVDLSTKLQITEGLGAIDDPRLQDKWRWVQIPGGSFIRGSVAEDAWPQEGPEARVTVSEYWIQRWPVTVKEFQRFLDDPNGYQNDQWWDEKGIVWRIAQVQKGPKGWEQTSSVKNRPVSGVCWWEASAYCRWYNSVVIRSNSHGVPEGYVVQLPTEAQWEYAAHPNPRDDSDPADTALYPWGTEWKEQPCANYLGSGLPVEGPTPVGLFWAGNNLRFDGGLWDLAGNVSEYCLDGFAPYKANETTDPLCDDYRHGAVIRGGHFRSSGLDLRITARFGVGRGAQLETAGFRCVAVRNSRGGDRSI